MRPEGPRARPLFPPPRSSSGLHSHRAPHHVPSWPALRIPGPRDPAPAPPDPAVPVCPSSPAPCPIAPRAGGVLYVFTWHSKRRCGYLSNGEEQRAPEVAAGSIYRNRGE